jgi:hypothetical protein
MSPIGRIMQEQMRMWGTFILRAVFGLSLLAALVSSPGSFGPIAAGGEAFAQLAPSSARAGQRSCSERTSLRSLHSREPTKITFVNQSATYRSIAWINFQGKLQEYGGLNPGDKKTINTFRTHPWMISTGPGDCLQLFMPAAEPATVLLK